MRTGTDCLGEYTCYEPSIIRGVKHAEVELNCETTLLDFTFQLACWWLLHIFLNNNVCLPAYSLGEELDNKLC